jgi:putative sterol carrier protein
MTAKNFLEELPNKVNPDALKGVNTVFHFNLDKGGLQKTLKVENGSIQAIDGLIGTANCVVSADSDVLMRIVKGEENPMMAVMMGKIKISNVGEMMKYAKLFGIM